MPVQHVNGIDIYYIDTVQDDKPTVIALHSSAASNRQWSALIDAQRDHYRFIVPDLTGYGQSGSINARHGDVTLSDEAQMVHALLDKLKAPAHLIGHSYGGAVALQAALETPDRIASLGLYEPVSFFVLEDEDPGLNEIRQVAEKVHEHESAGDHAAAMGYFVDYWNGNGTWNAIRPQTRDALTAVTPKLLHDFFAIMYQSTSAGALENLQIPTTIFCGENTRLPAKSVAKALIDILPNAELLEIKGAEHMSPVMQPDIVNPHLVSHLARHSRQPHQP